MYAFRSAMTGLILAGLSATASAAQDNLNSVIRQLRAQGYSKVEVERTWLGRYRIEARGPAGEREIVLNERTGEVLRDYIDDEGDDHDDDSGHGSSGSGTSGSGSSGSGSGSGSSGSGSGGDSSGHGGDDHGGHDSDGHDSGDHSGHGGDDGGGDD